MPEDARLTGLLADLAAEGDVLDALVRALPAGDWATPTPAPGWTIAHQIAHLTWTDRMAVRAADGSLDDVLAAATADPTGFVDAGTAEAATARPDELLAAWRDARTALSGALRRVPDGTKLPWFGPPMSAASMATARLMETWAHGQDVADALGVVRAPTERLRHVAYLGVRTRDFAFVTHGRTPPAAPVRVELAGPAGQLWAFGPHDAEEHVAGPALDFCLLVTRRRHRSDLRLVAHGAGADAWLDLAQAFAGPPGSGRAPRNTTT